MSSPEKSPPEADTSPPPPNKTPSSSPPPTKTQSPSPPTKTPSQPPPTKTPSQPPQTKTPPTTTPSTTNSSSPTHPSPPSHTSPLPPASSTPSTPAGGNTLPTTPSSLPPPSLPSDPGSGSGSGSGRGGSSTGVVAGIVVGILAILVVGSVICVYYIKKRKRRRDEYGGEGGYYTSASRPNHSPMGPKDGYGGKAQHWQQSYPRQANQYQVSKRPLTPASQLPLKSPSPQPSPSPAPPQFTSIGGGSESGCEKPLPPPPPGMVYGFSNKSAFTYEELAMATNGFSNANLLGQGGFGYVHKGILPNGKEVAVKALKAGSGQGEREFQAEVEIISRVHHKHLVSLVGYCITGSHRLLVYEYVPNQTMEFLLHDKGQPTMEWAIRLKIALGTAKGLAYLHEDCHPKIIHRDIKSANILLDYNFEAKVADFGLAKFSSDLHTHVSTRVMGTFGYLAPEYASSGKLTDKSDVFSFGVMLLELITGRKPVDSTSTYMDDSLVDWARPELTRALEENNFDSLVDPRLLHNFNPNEMTRMVACAAACVRHSARGRPRMSQVVRALEGEVSLSDLNEGIRSAHGSSQKLYEGSDYDSDQYKEDIKKFKKIALAGQEHSSGEYGGTTTESGIYSREYQTREMEMGKIKTDNSGVDDGDNRGFS